MTSEERAALVKAVGAFLDLPEDDRIALPVADQVLSLITWACQHVPDQFRRSIPMQATDHDVLITGALGKLVAEIVRLASENDRLQATIDAWTDGVADRQAIIDGQVFDVHGTAFVHDRLTKAWLVPASPRPVDGAS